MNLKGLIMQSFCVLVFVILSSLTVHACKQYILVLPPSTPSFHVPPTATNPSPPSHFFKFMTFGFVV